MVQTRKKTVVVKKKVWVPILSPENRELGESFVENPQTLVGRQITVNLMSLLNDPRKRKYNVSYIITSADSSSAKTKICYYETQPTAIRMLIRKGHDRVDDVVNLKTSDNKGVIVKPLYITLKNVSKSLATALRKQGRAVLKSTAKKTSYEALFSQIISQKIHKDLKKDLNKIYPVKSIEIKSAILVMEKKEEKKTKEIHEDRKEAAEEIKKEESEVKVQEDKKTSENSQES